MGGTGDIWRAFKEQERTRKAQLGIDCLGCKQIQPKRIPSRLLPGQVCRVCGYRAPRRIKMVPS